MIHQSSAPYRTIVVTDAVNMISTDGSNQTIWRRLAGLQITCGWVDFDRTALVMKDGAQESFFLLSAVEALAAAHFMFLCTLKCLRLHIIYFF